MTMELTKKVTMVYESPECSIVDIKAEGVLCNSFEIPEQYDDLYEW